VQKKKKKITYVTYRYGLIRVRYNLSVFGFIGGALRYLCVTTAVIA